MAGIYDQMLQNVAPQSQSSASDTPNIYSDMLSKVNNQTPSGPETALDLSKMGSLGPLDALHGFTEQAGRSATFGLQDKVGALVPALNAIVGHVVTHGELPPWEDVSKAYHDELTKQRGAGEAYASNHPVASKVASTIGAVGSLAPAAEGALPIIAGGEAAAPAATLGGRVAQGIKGGAAVGGISGFGNSNDESVSKDLMNTGTGSAIGGTIGGVAPVASEYVVQPIANWISRRFSSGALNDQAVQSVLQRVQKDSAAGGPTAQDMLDIINAAPGKPLALADVGGENVKALAGNVARAPGESRQIMTQFLTDRDVGAGSRLAGDVGSSLGNESAFDTANALQEARSAAAKPLYDQAFSANQNVASPTLDKILTTPAGKSALSAARVKMQNDMTLMGAPDADLMEQAKEAGQVIEGGKGVASGLKLRTWDYVKRALDDQIGVAQRAGENDNVRILAGLKSKLTTALDDADITARAGPNSFRPEGGLYAQARAAYSGPSQSIDALGEGQKLFNKSPSQIASEFTDLAPGDQEFYRLGAADALKQRIASTSSGGNEARTILGNQYAQDRLKAIFPDQDAFGRFIKSATAENAMFQTKQSVIGGSQTAPRVAEDSEGKSGFGANAIQTALDLAHGNVPGAVYAGARTLGGLVKRPDPKLNAEIARMLTETNPNAREALIRGLMAGTPQRPILPATILPLASLGGRALPSLTQPLMIPGQQ